MVKSLRYLHDAMSTALEEEEFVRLLVHCLHNDCVGLLVDVPLQNGQARRLTKANWGGCW